MSKPKKIVKFHVKLESSLNAIPQAMSDLEKAVKSEGIKDVKRISYSGNLGIALYETSKRSYEKLFKTELEYVEKTVNASVGRPQKISYYVAKKKESIPLALKGRIKYVELERQMYPLKVRLM